MLKKACAAAAAFTVVAASAHDAAADHHASKVITFSDGAKPELKLDGEAQANGDVHVELRFTNTNPLCFSYSTNLGGVESKAGGGLKPAPTSKAPTAQKFDSVDAAATGLRAAEKKLADALVAARRDASLEGLWGACGAGGNPAQQISRVEKAEAKLAQFGAAWHASVEESRAAAKAAIEAMETAPSVAAALSEVSTARANVDRAEKELRDAREKVSAASKFGKKASDELQDAVRQREADLKNARGALANVERKVAEAQRAQSVKGQARALLLQAGQGAHELADIRKDVGRASALISAQPVLAKGEVKAGEAKTVTVTKTPLVNGQPAGGGQTFSAEEIEALRPVLFNLSIGPALTLENTQKFGLGVGPSDVDGAPQGNAVRTRVLQTEDGLNMDGVVALSMYVWGKRYRDDRVFEPEFLIPRPMIGMSMAQPFSSIYAGLQIDPIQYLDISGGVRWYNREKLIGPAIGSLAAPSEDGSPSQPVTQNEVRAAAFVSVTASTHLFARWLGIR